MKVDKYESTKKIKEYKQLILSTLQFNYRMSRKE